MREKLEVLFVDDSAEDAESAARELRASGYEIHCARVDTPEELGQSLSSQSWDLVISEFELPALTGLHALRLARGADVDIPFIVVSETKRADAAVSVLKSGADDYVLKENIEHLRAVVPRELDAARRRREHKRARWARDLLADCTHRLLETIDYAEARALVVSLGVPQFADWCALDVALPGGELRGVAFKHVDPEKQPIGERLLGKSSEVSSAARVMRGSKSLLIVDVTDEALREVGEPAERIGCWRELGIDSLLVLPLRARGRAFGAMTFALTRLGRWFDRSDLPFAEELARRVALVLDNAASYERAREAIRSRDEMFCTLAHEFRTPLAALHLALESLSPDEPKAVEPDAAHSVCLGRARRSADRLVALIDGMLEVAPMASGAIALSLEPLELSALVADLAEQFRDQAAQAGCALSVHAKSTIVGTWDGFRLEQVLTNLLSNALKYARGGPIDVSVWKTDDEAFMSVADRGPGIPADATSRIFGCFERASRLEDHGSLGLGLYVSRRIVEAHGGTISVESRPGAGATFTVQLPLCARQR